MKNDLTRGSIFFCNLPNNFQQANSVEKGYRPVVIVSSLVGILSSDIINVCPITTKEKNLTINVPIGWSKDDRKSYILCNQIMTIPKNILIQLVGRLTPQEIDDMNKAILISLGITPSTVTNIKDAQEASIRVAKDKEELEKLLPEAKRMITELHNLVNRTENIRIKTKRVKRTPEDIAAFIKEWDIPWTNKKEVAEAFGFSSYSSAYAFRQRQI